MLVVALDEGFGGRVASALGVAPVGLDVRVFEGGEFRVRVQESVRGADVYVVQTVHADVHDRLVQLLFTISALKDAFAARVTAVLPYLCYARQDRRVEPRDPVPTRYVAQLLEAAGADCVVTMDVHDLAAFQNAFRIPVQHLESARWLARRVTAECVIAPDTGGLKRAERFRSFLPGATLAVVEKHRSGEGLRGGLLVGDVAGRSCVVVDDILSTGQTLARACSACLSGGATAVHAAVTHCLFHQDAGAVLMAAGFDGLVVADTVPPPRAFPGLAVEPMAPVFAEALRRMHEGRSVEGFLRGE